MSTMIGVIEGEGRGRAEDRELVEEFGDDEGQEVELETLKVAGGGVGAVHEGVEEEGERQEEA